MPWKKGQSGNPSGRPKRSQQQVAFEEMGRETLTKYALPELVSIVRNRDQYPKLWQWAVTTLIEQCFLPQVRESSSDVSISEGTAGNLDEVKRFAAELITEAQGGSPGSHVGDSVVAKP